MPKKEPSYVVQNCNFVGVQFDAKAVEAISTIAKGLLVNAEALRDLAGVLRASNVHIDALLRVGDDRDA